MTISELMYAVADPENWAANQGSSLLEQLAVQAEAEELERLKELGQSGKWPQQACTTMLFSIPKKVTSERPIALMPTLIRWWEAMRAPEVAKWQQRYRIEWDVTDGRNGGAQRTVWEILMEVERVKYRAGEEDLGVVALVLDLAKVFERVSLPEVWAWAILPGSKWSCLLLRIVLQDALSEVTQILKEKNE